MGQSLIGKSHTAWKWAQWLSMHGLSSPRQETGVQFNIGWRFRLRKNENISKETQFGLIRCGVHESDSSKLGLNHTKSQIIPGFGRIFLSHSHPSLHSPIVGPRAPEIFNFPFFIKAAFLDPTQIVSSWNFAEFIPRLHRSSCYVDSIPFHGEGLELDRRIQS
jgi:hypothetical protein